MFRVLTLLGAAALRKLVGGQGLPARLLGQGREIRLWGHPIGGTGGTLTESVVVQPGQWIEWTLETDLSRSAIGVY